ncbi:MAG: site-specific DNA-methyltransferase [Planctomycetaceae bacterium]|jgi:adenine-specific DNA-methyltransferase|nr:site-specific DNA-methyltransferase [Planctomycetaceae bacterium]
MNTKNSESNNNKLDVISNTGLKSFIEYNQSVKPNTELLDTLKKALPQFVDSEGNFKTDKFFAALKENNIAETRDGYKLGFVGKDYARLQTGCKPETLIAPDVKHNSKKENHNSSNIFITGDNIEVLRHLQNAYAEKIKMIYIDPPYNTRQKNFTYNDTFEFSDDKLKSLLRYGEEDIQRLKLIQGKSSHSAWLTFMYPRLKLAQKLLTDDGVIFVSIDDNEQANLKLLLDDIFGEGNFVTEIIRKTKSMTGDEGTGINIQHENLICFARNKPDVFFRGEAKEYDSYKNPDNDPRGEWTSGDPSAKSGGESTYFPIKNPFTRKKDYPPNGRFWAFSKTTCEEYIRNGKIKFKEHYKENERGFIFKRYKNDLESHYNPVDSLFTVDNEYMNAQGTTELFTLMNNNLFSNPKPTSLIKKLITYSTNSTDIILDFFAGSGTTAHAVMQLNAEDNGNRKFILVQIDEPTNLDSEARKAGYNTIDEIARERIKRAAKKIGSEKGLALPENFDGGFKHYRIAKPDVTTLDKIEKFNPNEPQRDFFDDMVTKFDDKITGAKGEEVILQTWLIHDGYTFDQQPEYLDFDGYQAYYIDQSLLYIICQGWGNKQTKKLLNDVGTHNLNLNTIIVYGYSFSIESLRELELGVKQSLSGQVLIERRY